MRDNQKRKLAIAYLSLFAYIGLMILQGIYMEIALDKTAIQPLLHYAQSGEWRYSLWPMRNMIALISGGHVLDALVVYGGEFLLAIPLGIYLPLFNRKNRTYGRTLIRAMALGIIIIITGGMRAIGVFELDYFILLILGTTVGYWIWQRCLWIYFIEQEET